MDVKIKSTILGKQKKKLGIIFATNFYRILCLLVQYFTNTKIVIKSNIFLRVRITMTP